MILFQNLLKDFLRLFPAARDDIGISSLQDRCYAPLVSTLEMKDTRGLGGNRGHGEKLLSVVILI